MRINSIPAYRLIIVLISTVPISTGTCTKATMRTMSSRIRPMSWRLVRVLRAESEG
jgi:hypothetical protein